MRLLLAAAVTCLAQAAHAENLASGARLIMGATEASATAAAKLIQKAGHTCESVVLANLWVNGTLNIRCGTGVVYLVTPEGKVSIR